MMRSLWSGVSGLNAHQIAMDVEGNNIANVNTVGFKYSRTNFQDLLSQTTKSATAPQGNLGGKNSLQVGLGSTVSSVETMFKQGSIQTTDKNTDLAINGDGFFIVSPDGGKTYKYTRAGDFTFDSAGNFVDPNGYIVQGWMADPDTHNIDSASAVKPINIPPGLTTPAKATSVLQIKANLNSGDTIKEMSGMKTTVSPTDDVNGLFDATGEEIKLKPDTDNFTLDLDTDGDGVADTQLKLTYGKSTSDTDGKFTTLKDILDEINAKIKDSSGETRKNVFLSGDGGIVDLNNTIIDVASSTNTILNNIFSSLQGPATVSSSLKNIQTGFLGSDDVKELFDANGEALNLEDGQGITVNIDNLGETRRFVYSNTPINSSTACTTGSGSYQGTPYISDVNEGLHWTYNSNGDRAYFNTGEKIDFTLSNGDTVEYEYGKDFQTINDLMCLVNQALSDRSINDTLSFADGKIQESDGNGITDVTIIDGNGNAVAAGDTNRLDRLATIFDGLDGTGSATQAFYKSDVYYFHDTQDLINIWQFAVDDSGDPLNTNSGQSGIVSIDSDGKLSVENTGTTSFNINVGSYPSDDNDNDKFTNAMNALGGTLASGGIAKSQAMNAATHTTSIDVFDSLGSKHTLTLHFRKTHTSENPNDPTTWNFYAEAPAPASLSNPAYGTVKFNPDGSLNSFTPESVIFNPNNGSKDGQAISFDFGDPNTFGGLTSFDNLSNTSGQTQDGYPGGDLQQLVVDQTGTVIGVFTNGRSYSLAQVAMAKFVNNEGLMHDGGSLFSASANSGDAIIGTAGTGGRGTIQASALEMSNVDLSRSLTQLIVIQRGFQANSKTITTSDQMLNELLQLKR